MFWLYRDSAAVQVNDVNYSVKLRRSRLNGILNVNAIRSKPIKSAADANVMVFQLNYISDQPQPIVNVHKRASKRK